MGEATSSTTAHSRQLSTSSTLSVSLRSHASEPLLRCKAHIDASVTGKLKPSDDFFSQLKELKESTDEQAGYLILSSQEIAHHNQLTDLKEELEGVVTKLREALVSAESLVKLSNEQNLCLQKQIKSEASAKLEALKECEILKEKLDQVKANTVATVSSLSDENARLLSTISDTQAREASYQKAIVAGTASNTKLLQDVESMKGALSGRKGNATTPNLLSYGNFRELLRVSLCWTKSTRKPRAIIR